MASAATPTVLIIDDDDAVGALMQGLVSPSACDLNLLERLKNSYQASVLGRSRLPLALSKLSRPKTSKFLGRTNGPTGSTRRLDVNDLHPSWL